MANDGPKDGDRKAGADGELVFSKGRWRRDDKDDATKQRHAQEIEQQRQSRLTHSSVEELATEALNSNAAGRARVAGVSSEQAAQLTAVAGVQISEDFWHVIDADHIRHSVNSSQQRPNEESIELTADDFTLLPAIVAAPDSIRRAQHDGPNNEPRIELRKRVNGHVFVITEVRRKHRELSVVTVVKLKATTKKGGE